MTGRPAALRALAWASTARVADSAMADRRAETRRRSVEGGAGGVVAVTWAILARGAGGTGSTPGAGSRTVNPRWLTSAMMSRARMGVLSGGGRQDDVLGHRRAVAQQVAH